MVAGRRDRGTLGLGLLDFQVVVHLVGERFAPFRQVIARGNKIALLPARRFRAQAEELHSGCERRETAGATLLGVIFRTWPVEVSLMIESGYQAPLITPLCGP